MAVEQRPVSRRARSAAPVTERELSQLAADGKAPNGPDNFNAGWSGGRAAVWGQTALHEHRPRVPDWITTPTTPTRGTSPPAPG